MYWLEAISLSALTVVRSTCISHKLLEGIGPALVRCQLQAASCHLLPKLTVRMQPQTLRVLMQPQTLET